IPRGPRHHLRRMIERAGRAQGELVPVLATGIGMLSTRAELSYELPLERIDLRDAIHLVREVRDVAGNLEAMGALELSAAPGMQELAFRVEHQHRGVLALEDVQAVAGMRRDAADEAEGLALGQFRKILDDLVGVLAGSDFHFGPFCR